MIRSTSKPQACSPLGARVAQAAERDRELGRPALAGAPGRDTPDTARQSTFSVGLSSVTSASNSAPFALVAKKKALRWSLEGVEREGHDVVPGEAGRVVEALLHHLVPLEQAGDHLARLAVPRQDADVERVAVVEDAHLGRLAGRRALPRLALAEARGDGRRPPRGLVEQAVHVDRRLDADGPQPWLVRGRPARAVGTGGDARPAATQEPSHARRLIALDPRSRPSGRSAAGDVACSGNLEGALIPANLQRDDAPAFRGLHARPGSPRAAPGRRAESRSRRGPFAC